MTDRSKVEGSPFLRRSVITVQEHQDTVGDLSTSDWVMAIRQVVDVTRHQVDVVTKTEATPQGIQRIQQDTEEAPDKVVGVCRQKKTPYPVEGIEATRGFPLAATLD